MKATVKITTEVEIEQILMRLPVMYGEEDIPNDFPLRNGDTWEATVDIDTGLIEGWPKDSRFQDCTLHMNVCDSGVYMLYGPHGNIVGNVLHDYVPHGVVPGEYGDYVELNIRDGVITNWPKSPDVGRFFEED